MHLLTTAAARFAGATFVLAFLAGCGSGMADGTTSETAVQATQSQSDAWAKAKAEGTDKTPDPNAKAKRGKSANFSGSPIR